jgi:hypothetical protein
MLNHPTFTNAGSITNTPGQVLFYGSLQVDEAKSPSIVLAGWAFAGWDNKVHIPVSIKLFSEGADGLMSDVTARFITQPIINGAGAVVIYDFNRDGSDDIFLPAHNESPLVNTSSTAFLSNSSGTFTPISLTDSTASHSGLLGSLNNQPIVVTAGYGGKDPYYQFNVSTNSFDVKYWGNTYSGSIYGSSAITWDMDADGKEELLIGDFKTGPGYDFSPTKPTKFVVYRLSDGALQSRPSSISDLWFDQPRYSNQSLVSDFSGLSHNYRVWVDDFNQDSKPDVLLGVGVWTAGPAGWQRSQLQMLQNQGNLSFIDATDRLNTAFDESVSFIDYSMQAIDLDGSGINSYLMGGDPSADFKNQSNYVLLNDGSGTLHVGLHSEFSEWSKERGFARPGKYIPYQNKKGGLDFLLIGISEDVYNVEVDYRPAVDFKEDLQIKTRNSSKNLRSWAGDDKVWDVGANGQTSIDFGFGLDYAIYSGQMSEYVISRSGNAVSLVYRGSTNKPSVSDLLINVERASFADRSIAFDVSNVAGQSYRIYKAAFDRTPDGSGLGYWIAQMDKGMNVTEVAARFIDSPEFRSLYGQNPSNAEFLAKVYTNVLGRTPDQGGYDWWLNELNTNPDKTRQKVLADFSESQENKDSVAALIGNGIQYVEFSG